jgi:uncharacterized protein (DUF2252 family)
MARAPLLTRKERAEQGIAARARVPLEAHAAWTPAPDRPDPIALLEEQARTRIPYLVPVRYGRMAVSPFTFYRGAALPMAVDLAPTPTSGLEVQACGDAHLSNFGLFASPERELVFDINDFDETLPGHWEWDLKRLVASIVVAGRERGFTQHDNGHAVHACVHSYRARMAEYAAMRAFDVFYARVNADEIMAYVNKRSRPFLESTLASTTKHDSIHELPKLTELAEGGVRRIVDHPPVITHPPELTVPTEVTTLAAYRDTLQEDRRVLIGRYRLVDAALKVVGVGSVGLAAFVALLDDGSGEDPLFLQAKEAEASILERFHGPSRRASHGERIVIGQRRLQAVSDVLLGWTVGPGGRHFYVRQLQDQKGTAVIDAMTYDDLVSWGRLCGWALARGHARSGDPVAIAAYLGNDNALDHALATFAEAYADQTERDHKALLAAIDSGRVTAERGV